MRKMNATNKEDENMKVYDLNNDWEEHSIIRLKLKGNIRPDYEGYVRKLDEKGKTNPDLFTRSKTMKQKIFRTWQPLEWYISLAHWDTLWTWLYEDTIYCNWRA